MAPGSGGVASSSPAAPSTKAHGILFWGAIIGGIILVLIIGVALVAPSALTSATVVGTYKHGSNPLVEEDILKIYNDGTYYSTDLAYVDPILTSWDGTWTVEGNRLKLKPNVMKMVAAGTLGCPNNIVGTGCQTKAPGSKIITLNIGVNQLVDEYGITWTK